MNFGKTTQGRRLRTFYNRKEAMSTVGMPRSRSRRMSQQNRLAAFYGPNSGLSNGG